MLTDEQILKGREALAKKNNEDIGKKLAFEWHKKAKEAFTLYSLPYKVYFDYLKDRYNNPPDTIAINPCYPLPGYPSDQVIKVKHDDFVLNDIPNTCRTLEEVYTYDNLCEDKKIEVDKLKLKVKPWQNLDNKWKKYFAVFLSGYDFMEFTEFDFFGKVGELSPGDLSLLRNFYTNCVMGEYKKNKDKFLLNIPKYEPEYRFLYSDKPFEVVWDKDTIMERVELERRMKIPPDERLRKLYMDQYGIDIYD